MKQSEVWVLQLDPTVGAEIRRGLAAVLSMGGE